DPAVPAVDVVLPSGDVLARPLADGLPAAGDRLGRVLPVLAGERRAVAPDQVVAERIGERETIARELELLSEVRFGLTSLVVRTGQTEVDLVPDIPRLRVGRDDRLHRLRVAGGTEHDPAPGLRLLRCRRRRARRRRR